MDVRNVVSVHEVETDDIMQTDNSQGDLIHNFSSWVIDGGAHSKRLWKSSQVKPLREREPPPTNIA